MRKGAPRTHSLALMAVLVLLAACTSPTATPGASTQTQTAAPVPTVEPTLAPDAPCRDCWPLTGKPLALRAADYPSGYSRVPFRPGPYNMFTSAAAMRQAIAAHGADTPQQIPSWGFLAASDHAPTIAGMSGGVPATDITIPYREDISLVKY